ncbi:MAG: rRNA maturation RNase YbeY [Bacilli bacterium]|nr:rRNA maturation RNase YbeY [Bacilli bacterium]MBO6286354.1 rRNA maturation RNase YbeY [Bacilli bacterium]
MELAFENQLSSEYDSLEETYGGLMKVAFDHLQVKKNYEVDVSLVDEETIHQINRDYRNVDRVTDVISFAFEDDDSALSTINGDDIPRMLGEIFVCVPRALEQAKEIGNTPERELCFLFVHGLLHLLGYDHMTKEEEEVMFPLQEKILQLYKEKKSHE